MIQKPYAAFGYVLIENTYADGEIVTAVINNDITCHTFWVQGLFKNKNLSANTDWEDFAAGHFLRPRLNYVQGIFEHTIVGETKVFCFDERINGNANAEFESFILKTGSETILPQNTKLFLCAGNLMANGKSIARPTQIRIQSGDTLVTATTDCYGLLFA